MDKLKEPTAANRLIDKALAQPSTESATPSGNAEPAKLRLDHLETIWLKMAEMFGHRWTGSFGESADPDHAWARVLAGLSGRQIANGLMLLSHSAEAWPPSAPAFRAMCLEVPGLPSGAEAWMQALRGSYTHEVVRVAAKLTGTYTLARSRPSDRAVQKQFEYHYAIVMRRFQNGEPLGGAVARAVGHDSQKSEAQLADEYADQLVRQRIEAQGVPQDPQAARVAMLARLGIKREGQGAGHGHA